MVIDVFDVYASTMDSLGRDQHELQSSYCIRTLDLVSLAVRVIPGWAVHRLAPRVKLAGRVSHSRTTMLYRASQSWELSRLLLGGMVAPVPQIGFIAERTEYLSLDFTIHLVRIVTEGVIRRYYASP